MTIFLILAPYGAFTLLMLVASPAISLFAAAAICLDGDRLSTSCRGRSIKMLGAGSAVAVRRHSALPHLLVDPSLEQFRGQARGRLPASSRSRCGRW